MNEDVVHKKSKIPWIISVFFFSSVFITRVNIYGSYILFGLTAIMLLAYAFNNRGRIAFKIDTFHKITIIFASYCTLSSIWGLNAFNSLTKGITIFEILMCMSVFYAYFASQDDGFYQLLKCVLWTGYIVTLYTFFYYKGQIIKSVLLNAGRLDNSFNNINEIAMLFAITIVLTLHFGINERLSPSMILSIPSFILLIACNSKRAIFILLFGIILIIFGKSESRNQNTLLKRILVVFVILGSVYYLFSNSLLLGLNERLGDLLFFISGKTTTDHSTLLRLQFIQYGFQIFIEHPIFGIGIGCTNILVSQKFGIDCYLHNNFVELLAGGGILGFLIFYSYYYQIVRRLMKNNIDRNSKLIVIFLLGTLIITDTASGSYYAKEIYFLLMISFICVDKKKV